MRKAILLSLFLSVLAIAQRASAQNGPYQYYSVTPCRVVDTRNANGTNGGPSFTTNTTRDFAIRGNCGIPTTAKAVSLNVTAVGASAPSFLTLWPSGLTRPNTSALNFESTDPSLANGAIVGLSTNTQDLSVYNNFGTVNVIIDVTGYFQ